MAYTPPARAPARWNRPTVYRARRRSLLLGVVLVALLAYAAGRVLSDTRHVHMPAARARTEDRRTYASAVSWPQQGQAALLLANGQAAAGPGEQPVLIAKVMTAYLTLERYPLSGARDGFTITVTPSQAQAVAQDAVRRQSAVCSLSSLSPRRTAGA